MIPETLLEEFTIRNIIPQDHHEVLAVMKDWWGGRDLTYALPRLFFDHFNDSSFAIYHQNQIVAFLIGFLSPSKANEGYIHFAGVHPSFRKIGLGSHLYSLFFDFCRSHNRTTITSCTSPVNKGSIQFHIKQGFEIEPGDSEVEGTMVCLNYNRVGDHKVLFKKTI